MSEALFVGPWRFQYNAKPIPDRGHDWDYWHEEYDGAEDSGDTRKGTARTFADALEEVCAEHGPITMWTAVSERVGLLETYHETESEAVKGLPRWKSMRVQMTFTKG